MASNARTGSARRAAWFSGAEYDEATVIFESGAKIQAETNVVDGHWLVA